MSRKLTTGTKAFHLVFYVEDSSPKVKKFYDKKAMKRFVEEFQAEFPDSDAINTGSWVDSTITDIKGRYAVLSRLHG